MAETYGFNKKDSKRINDVVGRVEHTPLGSIKRSKHKPHPGGSGDTYNGPFKVIKKDDTMATIKGFDATDRPIHNNIIAGLSALETEGDVDVSISSTRVIYMKLLYNSGYTISFGSGAELPVQANNAAYVSLAHITFTSGAITNITQIQYGDIHIAGRLV